MEKWEDKIIQYKNWNNFKHDSLILYNKQLKQTNKRKHMQQPSQPKSILNVDTEQHVEQMSVLSEATQSSMVEMCNLTTANAALVNT